MLQVDSMITTFANLFAVSSKEVNEHLSNAPGDFA